MTAEPRGPVLRRPVPPAILRQHETSRRRDRPGRFAAGSGKFCKRYPGQETGVRAGPPARYRWDEVDRLLGDLDFPALYRGYARDGDTWEKGFPEIYQLEQKMTTAAKGRTLGLGHVQEIARRDGIPDHNLITCPGRLSILLYIDDAPAYWLMREPESSIRTVEDQIPGLGPACTSRVLRFAVPAIFGAIDAPLVRVFGHGDPGAQRYHLLDLAATPAGTRWTISARQPAWPGEYGAWIKTLQAIARRLNREEVCCAHPEPFLRSGLRDRDIWAAADVEMALSSYASEILRKKCAPMRC